MMKGLLRLIEELQNFWFFLIVLIVNLLASYQAYKTIEALPKPETIQETISFYFNHTSDYLYGILFCLICSILWLLLSASLIYSVVKDRDEYNLFGKIVLWAFGLVFLVTAFYFASYFFLLLISLIIIGVIAIIFIKGLSNGSKSYR